jgi:hypothetical protein
VSGHDVTDAVCLLVAVSGIPGLNSAVFWDVTERRLVRHRSFGATCGSHFQGSGCLKRSPSLAA